LIFARNCFSTHLLKYLFAKVLIASRKKIQLTLSPALSNGEFSELLVDDAIFREHLSKEWELILLTLGMHTSCCCDENCGNTVSGSSTCFAVLAFAAACKLVDISFKIVSELTVEEWTNIRNYFEFIGRKD
jgi:hypothetical protein